MRQSTRRHLLAAIGLLFLLAGWLRWWRRRRWNHFARPFHWRVGQRDLGQCHLGAVATQAYVSGTNVGQLIGRFIILKGDENDEQTQHTL